MSKPDACEATKTGYVVSATGHGLSTKGSWSVAAGRPKQADRGSGMASSETFNGSIYRGGRRERRGRFFVNSPCALCALRGESIHYTCTYEVTSQQGCATGTFMRMVRGTR